MTRFNFKKTNEQLKKVRDDLRRKEWEAHKAARKTAGAPRNAYAELITKQNRELNAFKHKVAWLESRVSFLEKENECLKNQLSEALRGIDHHGNSS